MKIDLDELLDTLAKKIAIAVVTEMKGEAPKNKLYIGPEEKARVRDVEWCPLDRDDKQWRSLPLDESWQRIHDLVFMCSDEFLKETKLKKEDSYGLRFCVRWECAQTLQTKEVYAEVRKGLYDDEPKIEHLVRMVL